MASRILIGKSRFASRSDREREKLQAQISTYALRHNAERDAEQHRLQLARLEAQPEPSPLPQMDGFIDWAIALVSGVVSVILISVLLVVA